MKTSIAILSAEISRNFGKQLWQVTLASNFGKKQWTVRQRRLLEQKLRGLAGGALMLLRS